MTTPADKAFLDMLSVFAEFETSLRRERCFFPYFTSAKRLEIFIELFCIDNCGGGYWFRRGLFGASKYN